MNTTSENVATSVAESEGTVLSPAPTTDPSVSAGSTGKMADPYSPLEGAPPATSHPS
jgi:hypothetical protein